MLKIRKQDVVFVFWFMTLIASIILVSEIYGFFRSGFNIHSLNFIRPSIGFFSIYFLFILPWYVKKPKTRF